MGKSKSNIYKPQAKTADIHRITPGAFAPFHNQTFGKQQQLSKPVQSFDEWGTKRAAEEQYPGGRYMTNGGYNHTRPHVEDPAVAFLNSVLAEYRAKGQHTLTVSISGDPMDCDRHPNELMDVDEPRFDLDMMDVDEVQMAIPVVDPSTVCVPMDITEGWWVGDSWAMDIDVKDQMTAPFGPPGIPAFSSQPKFAPPRSGFGAEKAYVEQELASGLQALRFPAPAPTYSYTPTPPKYNVPTPIVRAQSATRPALSNVQNHPAPHQLLPSTIITSNHSQITNRKASLTLEIAYITLGIRSLEISTLDRAVVTSRSPPPTPEVTTSTALIVREPEPVKTPVITEVLCQCKRVATTPVAETQIVLRSVSPITNSPPSTNTDESSCFNTADLLRLDFEDPVHSTPIASGASPYPAWSPESVELWEDLASLKGALFCSPVEKDLLLFDPIPLAESLTGACEPYHPVDSGPESSIVSPAPAYESYDRPPSASELSSPESVDDKPLLLNVSAEGKLLAPITSNGVTKIMQFRYRRSVRDKKRDKKSSDKRRSPSPTSSPNSIGGTRQLTRVTDVGVPLKHKRAENEPSETEVHTNADFSAPSDRPIASNSRIGKMGEHDTKSPLPAVSKEASKVNSFSSPSSPRKSTTTNNAVSRDKPSKSTLLPLSTDMPGGYPKSPSPPPKQLSANEMVAVSTPATISSPTRVDAIKADNPSSVDVEVSPSVPATTPTDYFPYTHAAMEKEGRLVRRRPFIYRASPALRPRRNPAESVDPKGARQCIRLAEPTKVEKATPLRIPFAPPTPVIVQAVAAAPKPFHSKSKLQSQTTCSVLRQWIGFRNRGEEFKVLPAAVPNADYHDLDVVHAVPLPPPSIWTRGMVRFFGWA